MRKLFPVVAPVRANTRSPADNRYFEFALFWNVARWNCAPVNPPILNIRDAEKSRAILSFRRACGESVLDGIGHVFIATRRQPFGS